MLDEAVNYIIDKNISLDIFTNELVQKCYEKREKKMIEKLFHSLKNISLSKDPSQAQKLIEQVINFLSNLNAHTDLIQLYELMNEYLKAGLEALKLTKIEKNVDVRKDLFKCAGNNFEKYIHNLSNKDYMPSIQIENNYPNSNIYNLIILLYYYIITIKVLNNNLLVDLNGLIHLRKTILLQIEVLDIIPEIPYSLLKNDTEQRLLIVQEIIQKNDELAIKIINEYEINVQQVFFNATIHLMKNKLFDEHQKLLDIMVKWDRLKLFDKFKVNYINLVR